MEVSLEVVVKGATSSPVCLHGDFADARPRLQDSAFLQSFGPISNVRRGLRPNRAAEHALPVETARRPPLVVAGNDGIVRNPPVPAELVETASNGLPQHAQGQRRSGTGRPGRVRRVPGKPGHAHLAVVQVIVRLQVFVADWPIVRHAVERFHSKVRRMHAREVPRPVDRASSHRVEHQDVRRIGAGRYDGIVLGEPPHVRTEVERPSSQRSFPLRTRGGVVRRLDPLALLQANHLRASVGQAPNQRCARRARADDQHIRLLFGHLHTSR